MNRPVAILGALMGVLAWCAPASASLQRGHVFGSSFGVQGTGPGQLDRPTDLAVDEASGDVYVVDSGAKRIEAFRPGANGDEYAFTLNEKEVRAPFAIAVDNSRSEGDPTRGDVFVAGGAERDIVYVYSPTEGRVVAKLHELKAGEEEEELEEISGVAVNAAGTLWVSGKKKASSTASRKPRRGRGECGSRGSLRCGAPPPKWKGCLEMPRETGFCRGGRT